MPEKWQEGKFETAERALMEQMLTAFVPQTEYELGLAGANEELELLRRFGKSELASRIEKDLGEGKIFPALALVEVMLDFTEEKMRELEFKANQPSAAPDPEAKEFEEKTGQAAAKIELKKHAGAKEVFTRFADELILKKTSREWPPAYTFADAEAWLAELREKVVSDELEVDAVASDLTEALDNFLAGHGTAEDAETINLLVTNADLYFSRRKAQFLLVRYFLSGQDAEEELKEVVDQMLRLRQFRAMLEEIASKQ